MCLPTHSPTNFDNLPTELQLLVYRYAVVNEARVPRVHSLYPTADDSSVYISNQGIPALIHLSSTTRAMYLQTIEPTYIYGTYLNFKIDTLYLATCPDLSFAQALTPYHERNPATNVKIVNHQKRTENGERDGFEICKALGKNLSLMGNVRRVAINDSFWLRPQTVTRSIVVEAWNVLVKDGLGGGLEELSIVFASPYAAKSASERKQLLSSSGDSGSGAVMGSKCEEARDEKRRTQVIFETIGYYQKIRDEFGERMEIDPRARRCDEFLRAYLSVSLGGGGWMRPVIKYVAYKEI